MSEGTASAQRINEMLDIQESQRLFMASVDHPADENQGRGMDHLAGPSYLRSVTGWLVAGCVACIMAIAIIIMGDQT